MDAPFQYQGYALPIFSDYLDTVALPISAAGLKQLGATTIQINPALYQDTLTSNTIHKAGELHGGQTVPSDDTIRLALSTYKAAGLNLDFKVTLNSLDSGWSGNIAPTDVNLWFQQYKAAVVHWATIAQEYGVTQFIITNEMPSMTSQYRAQWLDLIAGVREVFHGAVGVNAQEPAQEPEHLSFGDALDFVGVSLYPVVTHSTSPTVQELENGWRHDVDGNDWVKILDGIHDQFGKPVEVTELAFLSRDGAAASGNYWDVIAPADQGEQRDQYEAFFGVFSNMPEWFKGVTFWQWIADDPVNGWRGKDPYLGPTGSHIIGKLAQDTVQDWFLGERQTVGLTLTGTSGANSLYGGSNRDTFLGSAGSDHLYGWRGVDHVIYAAAHSGFAVTHQSDGTFTVAKPTGGMDALSSVERVEFNDGRIALDLDGTNGAGAAYRIYQAAFDRTPDVGGLTYWTGQADKNMSTIEMAARFMDSDEFRHLYGSSNPPSDQFIELIYQNVLHRSPDQGGHDYWAGQLTHGMAEAEMLARFADSAENRADVIGVIANGIWLNPEGDYS